MVEHQRAGCFSRWWKIAPRGHYDLFFSVPPVGG